MKPIRPGVLLLLTLLCSYCASTIEFAVSKKNGAVDLTSIRCIGAG